VHKNSVLKVLFSTFPFWSAILRLMPQLTTEELQKIAHELRIDVLEMLKEAKSGHPASALGLAEILSVLYFSELNVNPKDSDDKESDKFIFSNGHACPILYATLAKKGYFPKSELKTLRKIGALLQGHPNRKVPGVETASGSLGQGLSIGVGEALTSKMDKLFNQIYVLTSDGELNEGQTWEAVMLTTKYNLDNLTWIIDRNNIQIGGTTENILPLENLREKLESFNWYVIEIDGHNITEIKSAFRMAKNISGRPTGIIAHTIPGKGVDFMEKKFEWHGKAPSGRESEEAIDQIKKLLRT